MATRTPITSLLCSLSLLAALACQRPLARGGGSGEMQRIVVGAETREYLLHAPAALDPAEPSALVLNLHGFSSNAFQQQTLSGMSAKADAEGFLVVYPQAVGSPPTWRVGPLEGGQADLQFIADLIAHLSSEYSIDPRRIFATGISNGGGMVDRLACERADRIAAAAPVSGAYLFSAACSPSRPVPIVAFHGTADQIVPYAGQGAVLPPINQWIQAWANRNGCTAGPEAVYQVGDVTGEAWGGCSENAHTVLYTIDGGGHNWPGASLLPGFELATQDVDATDVIWEFFLEHPMR